MCNKKYTTAFICVLQFFLLWLILSTLDQDAIWNDEAWSLWAVRGSWADMWQRIAADVHPPLYFILLYGWVRLGGESVWAVQMLSAWCGLLGLATTYTVGRYLFDRNTGFMALVWLGTHSFFLYYARETRMYALLLYLTALSTWAYLVWRENHGWRYTAVYALTIAALPSTHYFGTLIPLIHGLHLLLTWPFLLRRWFKPAGLGLLLFSPWLPILWKQVHIHPDGPLIIPVSTNWDSVRWLFFLCSGGAGLYWTLPLLGQRHTYLHHHKDKLILLLLWIVLPPLFIFTINAHFATFHAARYAISILPAAALLTAYALRHLYWRWVGGAALIALLITNLSAYQSLWPTKTPWGTGVPQQVVQLRHTDEPTLLMIADPSGLEAYYDHTVGLHHATTQEIMPGQYTWAQMQTFVRTLPTETAVWLMMPGNVGDTWLAAAALDKQRHVSYQHHTANFLFYRFDTGNHTDLQFHFGEEIVYTGKLFAIPLTAGVGDKLCVDTPITAVTNLQGNLSYGIHLVDQHNKLIGQLDEGLGIHLSGTTLPLHTCLEIPFTTPPGTYYLHLVIYYWENGQRLPVLEQDTLWGDALIFDVVYLEK